MGDVVRFEDARVHRSANGWVVRIPTEAGEVVEYEYRTRKTARYFAAIFRLRPTWYPQPDRRVATSFEGLAEADPTGG